MNRLLFEKTGKAIYISHLDTMAMFPRVFLRAGLHIKFTQGMSPHAYVSVALPLSVGMSSRCEILDFTLEEDDVPLESLPERLNPYFPAGIRVLSAYDSSRKIKELRYLQCNVRLEYDGGAGDEVRDTLNAERNLCGEALEKGHDRGGHQAHDLHHGGQPDFGPGAGASGHPCRPESCAESPAASERHQSLCTGMHTGFLLCHPH